MLSVSACSTTAEEAENEQDAAGVIAERVLTNGEGLCASDMGGESYTVVEIISVEDSGQQSNVEVRTETEDGREFTGELTIDLVEECATYISLVGTL